MKKVVKQSKALILLLTIVLILSPLSVFADASKKVNYVALGDSLAAGILSNNTPGAGYVGHIANDLKEKGYDVNLANKGIPGATSVDVLNGLNGIDELTEADLITLSVGANDVLSQLDVSLLDEVDVRYLDPDQLKHDLLEAVQALETAKIDATEAVTSADTIVTESTNSFDTIQVAIIELMNKVSPIESLLPPEVLGVLNDIQNNTTEAATSIASAVSDLNSASENANTDINVTIEKLAAAIDHLESATTKLNAIVGNIEAVETFIQVSPTPIPEEIMDTIQNAKSQANEAAETIGGMKTAIENASDAVITVTEAGKRAAAAQSLAEDALEFSKKVDQMNMAIQTKMTEVSTNIVQIIENIKATNPTAKIYVMGYYNALPYLDEAITLPILDGLNKAIQGPTMAANTTYIPTFELFKGNYQAYLPNPENIHPSDAGYSVIASAFIGEINKSFPKIVELEDKVDPKKPIEREEVPVSKEPKEKEDESKDTSIIIKDDDSSGPKLTAAKGEKLPKTATNYFNMALIGTLLLLAGIIAFIYGQRKRMKMHDAAL